MIDMAPASPYRDRKNAGFNAEVAEKPIDPVLPSASFVPSAFNRSGLQPEISAAQSWLAVRGFSPEP
ncbi:MAG TPA: hypothetical protein PLG56_06405, partial [Lacunisphaera sp.]|nr:hypothetical protein [Lacunisphaera sp.]